MGIDREMFGDGDEGEKQYSEVLTAIEDVRKSEAERYAKTKTTQNEENKNLRERMKLAEDKAKKYEDYVNDKSEDVKTNPEYQRLNGDLETLRKEFSTMQTENAEVKARDKRTRTRIALSALLKGKTPDPDYLAKSLISDGSVDLDGDALEFITGDTRIGIDAGLETFFKDHPALKATPQQGGADSNGGSKQQDDSFTRDKLLEMKRAQRGSRRNGR